MTKITRGPKAHAASKAEKSEKKSTAAKVKAEVKAEAKTWGEKATKKADKSDFPRAGWKDQAKLSGEIERARSERPGHPRLREPHRDPIGGGSGGRTTP
jgi:hypothetical protein